MPIVNENKLTAAFVQQYHDSYEVAAMQDESRLLKTVHNRGKIQGESFTINDMGQVEMQASGARFGSTVLTIPDTGVRTALMSDFDLFIPIENRDLPKLKANPSDKYMTNLISARNRKTDDIIYQSLIGGVTRTTVNDAGVKSVSTIALPASQIILNGFGTMKQKIIKAKTLFRKNECDEKNGEKLYMIYTADMMEMFLNDTTLTNADHMKIQMLSDGEVGTKWLGVEWVPYEKVSNGAGGATEARAAMYTGSAVHFGDADIAGFDISTRPDLKNIKQVGGVHSFGSGRSNEVKVVALDYLRAS